MMNHSQLNADSLLRKSQSLHLASKTIADSMKSGAFKSFFRGRGIEFSGVREYLRGDDVRSIDWNVTARMGKAFVKQFEEDRELVLFLVIDASLSMQTGASKNSRIYTACETAALAAFAASHTNSPVGYVVFDGDISFSCEPKAGKDQVPLLLSKLENLLQQSQNGTQKTPKGSVLDKALKGTAKMLRKRSLVLIVSDFRVAGYEKSLAILGMRHDVVALRITDPSDTELPDLGSVLFEDSETGITQHLPTNSVAFRRAWRENGRNSLERWQTECTRRGVYPLEISTESDPAQRLQFFFSARERT